LNLASILMLILFTKEFGIIALPFGLLLGGIMFFFYQIFLMGFRDGDNLRIKENNFNFRGWGAVVFLIFFNSLLPSFSGLSKDTLLSFSVREHFLIINTRQR